MARYNIRNIRSMLTEGFNPEELRELAYAEPDFRPVYEQLSSSAGKTEIVQRLIEYAERQSLLDHLLDCAKERNLACYEQYQPYTASLTDPLLPPAVKQAVATLDNPIQSERLNAIESLAALVEKYPIAQEKLAEAVQGADYPDVRIHAAFMLVRFKDARALPGLIEALNNRENTVSLSRIKRIDIFYYKGLAFPTDELIPVHDVAIWALGQIQAIQELVEILYNEGGAICIFAVLALGQTGDAIAVPYLCEVLHNSILREAREAAAKALGQLGNSAAIPDLLNAMLDDIAGDVRKAAYLALERIGFAAVPTLIETLYRMKDQRDCLEIITLLKRIDSPEALAAVEKWLGNLHLPDDYIQMPTTDSYGGA